MFSLRQERRRVHDVQTTARFRGRPRRYVERNALRAGLVARAEDRRWGALWRPCNGGRGSGGAEATPPLRLHPWPVPEPAGWLEIVNAPQSPTEEAALRCSVTRSRPFGADDWTAATAVRLGLDWTLRSRGGQEKRREKC